MDADVPNEADGGFIGGEIGAGVGLRFIVTPDFGTSFEHNDNTITVTEAEFTIVDLRLIGDSAAGDERTSKDVVDLQWETTDVVEVGYEDAPAGLYSLVRGTVVAFSIEGDVVVNGESAEYDAEKNGVALPIEFELPLNLEAGGAETVTVLVDTQNITDEIPFEGLEVDNGEINIDEDSEAMEKIEEKITESFFLE